MRSIMWLLLTPATFLERWITPVTMQLAPPLTLVRQVLRTRERIAVLQTVRKDWGPRQLRSRILQLWQSDLHLAQSSRETNQGHLDASKVERKPLVSLLFTSHTSLVFVMQHSGAGNVAAGRQAADVHRGRRIRAESRRRRELMLSSCMEFRWYFWWI